MKVLENATYLCLNCGNTTKVQQDDVAVKAPVHCKHCKSVGPWKMLLEESVFVDMPDAEWQELKRAKALIDANEVRNQACLEIKRLKNQIAEANKILDAYDKESTQNFERQYRNQRLREALK